MFRKIIAAVTILFGVLNFMAGAALALTTIDALSGALGFVAALISAGVVGFGIHLWRQP
jgi:hypothetical protein